MAHPYVAWLAAELEKEFCRASVFPSGDWLATELEKERRRCFDIQFPHFFQKPRRKPREISNGWDVCAARIFAPRWWKREESKNSEVWTLDNSTRNGIYVDRADLEKAFLPGQSWLKTHDNLDAALLDHFRICQQLHAPCLQRNILQAEIRLAEIESGIPSSEGADPDPHAHDDEEQLLEELRRAESEDGIPFDEDADAEGEDDEELLEEIRRAELERGIPLGGDADGDGDYEDNKVLVEKVVQRDTP
ncbi:hypothetical protein DFH06DRAFT_1339537 [Mycena polygramma]|nr:hypothetical protein DFH06DRAFT_1339537 [Mycena polygramma]